MKKMALFLGIGALLVSLSGCGNNSQKDIILSTTTSTQDSGLLDYLLPVFEEETGYNVKVIAVGTGAALQNGKDGEADVLLVHSKASEEQFVSEGHADEAGRIEIMYNDFIIVGPKNDPLSIKTDSYNNVSEAFKTIDEANSSKFISRADNSGTHNKEMSVWEMINVDPKNKDYYVEAGTGMGAVLEMANEKDAYTLTDRATWLNNLDHYDNLQIVSENDPSGILYNQYSCICVNPNKNDKINYKGAKAFQNWLISDDTQALIGKYGVEEFGAPLFTPNYKK